MTPAEDSDDDENHVGTNNENIGCDFNEDGQSDLNIGKAEKTDIGVGKTKEAGKSLNKKTRRLKTQLGLFGCVLNIAQYVLAFVFSLIVEKFGINHILKLIGLQPKPVNFTKGEKRKHSELDTEDFDEETTKDLEIEVKRWRPDHVFEAINEFVKKMWGEKDSNENIKVVDVLENDENMNSFASVNDEKWNKKPDINFVCNKIIEIKNVGEAENLIKDLTPKKTILKDGRNNKQLFDEKEGVKEVESKEMFDESVAKGFLEPDGIVETSTPLVQSNVPEVFVFNGDKSAGSNVVEDVPEDEQSMLSQMTFQEKKVYFAQQINDQAAAAIKSAAPRKSPPGSKSPKPILGDAERVGSVDPITVDNP
eukprot:GFUD01017091.1.p1 GENE.GFUD01017091.1~~GFUD01017091.1.p1  ORF type:complete len:365 (+),score=110.27 GFUD01017091.1:62-1156(+)